MTLGKCTGRGGQWTDRFSTRWKCSLCLMIFCSGFLYLGVRTIVPLSFLTLVQYFLHMFKMIISTILAIAAYALAAPLERRQAPSGVPAYVVQYAPIVRLYSSETYLPSDIGAQLTNTNPTLNFTAISNAASPLTLDNLNSLNSVGGGEDVYLTSKDNVEKIPVWLLGVKPDSTGKTDGAVSCAIIVNDHGNGLVDAFYMYFYAFNYGGTYFGHTIGDHVGDWEHNMVRFQNGKPQAVWYSQHNNGEAFTYSATMKYNNGLRVSGITSPPTTKQQYANVNSLSCSLPTVVTRTTPSQELTVMAFQISICHLDPSTTIRTQARCGILPSAHITTLTMPRQINSVHTTIARR